MGLQPTNFRDVGDALSLWLEPSPLPRGRLLRGGKFDELTALADLGSARTILNLRRGPDPTHLAARLLHVPASDELENYDTRQHRVRQWLGRALDILADPATEWPVYVHCTSGRDRTGVVIAAALISIGVPRNVVFEEYMLSDGADADAITLALDGMAHVVKTAPAGLRAALLGGG
ncbi:MAG: hypothetical protein HOW73_22435 [Polyangiaceae bacterium]|nr:hypothetical protein [Polyangiaceae bacterium]